MLWRQKYLIYGLCGLTKLTKVISTKEIPTGKKTQFINKQLGIDAINKLLSKGFNIG